MQCIPRHLQLTIVESALCCPCLEPLFSLGSQTACTQCTFSTLPGVIVPGTGSQPSYTASSEQAPIHFTAENSISGTLRFKYFGVFWVSTWFPVLWPKSFMDFCCYFWMNLFPVSNLDHLFKIGSRFTERSKKLAYEGTKVFFESREPQV